MTVFESSAYRDVEALDTVNSRGNTGGLGINVGLMLYDFLGIRASGFLHQQGVEAAHMGPVVTLHFSKFRIEGQYGVGTSSFSKEGDRSTLTSHKTTVMAVFIGYKVEEQQNSSSWIGLRYSRIEDSEKK